MKGKSTNNNSKPILKSSSKFKNVKPAKQILNMTCASLMGLPNTPTKKLNDTIVSQMNLPSTPTTSCSTIIANESTLLNNTRATNFDLPDSPSRCLTPVPRDILTEFLSVQILAENSMVYAKCHDGWIYPAFISDKHPNPGQSKYKVRFQDDNTEKQISKNHVLRIHLLPKEVEVFYTDEDSTVSGSK